MKQILINSLAAENVVLKFCDLDFISGAKKIL